jgi:hypothetical protein
MSDTKKYTVLFGFLHGRIDETTGEGLVPYEPGQTIELTADEAAVELQRNRIAPVDEPETTS